MPVDLDALRALGASGPAFTEGRQPLSPVRQSRDLNRILELPEQVDDDGAELVEALTKPGAELGLWPIQARALAQAKRAKGLFAPIAVGGGKTLIASLLPSVIACERPVILTMPGLVKQGARMMGDYRASFRIREGIQWVAYSTLSAKSGAGLLDELKPDLVIADEAHTLTGKSARARRFARYLAEHPDTRCCFLSGTMAQRSILDFAKLLGWALGEGSPLPLHYPTLAEWAEALDLDGERPAGALERLCRLGETPREGFRRRLLSAPGVVGTTAGAEVRAHLEVVHAAPPCPPELTHALADTQRTFETPDGVELMSTLEVARVLRQLRLGGYYVEQWPEDALDGAVWAYKEARADWARFVREVLKRPRAGLDSPGLVADAVRAGELVDQGALAKFDRVRSVVSPLPPFWEWITDEVFLWAAGKARQSPRVVFVDCVPVGEAVARAAGIPYYGAGDAAAADIAGEDGTRSIVASIGAHGTGRNLQQFSDALVLGGLPNGKQWEQLLGRLHRPGQRASVVTYEVTFDEDVRRAKRQAGFVAELLGNAQKLDR